MNANPNDPDNSSTETNAGSPRSPGSPAFYQGSSDSGREDTPSPSDLQQPHDIVEDAVLAERLKTAREVKEAEIREANRKFEEKEREIIAESRYNTLLSQGARTLQAAINLQIYRELSATEQNDIRDIYDKKESGRYKKNNKKPLLISVLKKNYKINKTTIEENNNF